MLALRALILIPVIAASLIATDPFYLGTYKIDSAKMAPWADGGRKPTTDEMKSLVGKIVVFKSNEITGPRQVACKGPKYVVKDYPPDMLYQGAFGEMQSKDKKNDPAKIAAGLGFHGPTSKTVETGCATELDFHFLDDSTATFGLNDFVYYLKKQ